MNEFVFDRQTHSRRKGKITVRNNAGINVSDEVADKVGNSDPAADIGTGTTPEAREHTPAKLKMGLKVARSIVTVTALATVLLVAGGTATAKDTPVQDKRVLKVINRQTKRCLDSNVNGDVYAGPCNGGNYQNWIISFNVAIRRLKNVSTGFCLDSNADGDVYTHDCNDGNFQTWHAFDDGVLKNESTGFCLDSDANGNVYTRDCNDGNYQNWDVRK